MPPTKHDPSTQHYIQANRQAWNETAGIHREVSFSQLLERVQEDSFTTFDDVEAEIFADIGIADKDVVQLACNNGRELLSIKKHGAARCVGFDISDDFIEQAKALSAAGRLEAEFVRSNVYDIPESYHQSFDLAYITIGALGWLPDIYGFLDLVAQLLRPKGQLFIYEMHPMLNMFDGDTGLKVKHSYFKTTPYVEAGSPDYLDPSQVIESESYWFHHKVSDILSACLEAGLQIKHYQEYDHDISEVYKDFAHFDIQPAMCFSLVAQKAN